MLEHLQQLNKNRNKKIGKKYALLIGVSDYSNEYRFQNWRDLLMMSTISMQILHK